MRIKGRISRVKSRSYEGGSGGEPIGDEFYATWFMTKNRPFGRTLAYDFDHYVVYI